MVPLTCAALGGVVFGPIGALVSFKLSTGIASAIGGSALTYSLASYIRNKNKAKSEMELEHISNHNQHRQSS